MKSSLAGIRGGLGVPAGAAEARVQPQLGGRATSASRSAASSPRTSRTAGGSCSCRSRGRSSSRTRTTAASSGLDEPAVDDSLRGIPLVRQAPVPLERPRACSPSRTRAGRRAATRSSRSSATSRSATRTSCSPAPTRTATPALARAARRLRGGRTFGADAYDWNFCWKVWDALRSCAYDGDRVQVRARQHAQHRSNGRWSDGVPIAPLKIQDPAPIRP